MMVTGLELFLGGYVFGGALARKGRAGRALQSAGRKQGQDNCYLIASSSAVGVALFAPVTIVTVTAPFLAGYASTPVLSAASRSLLQPKDQMAEKLNGFISVTTIASGYPVLSAATMAYFHTIKFVNSLSQQRKQLALTNGFSLQQSMAWVERCGTVVEIPVDAVALDDIVHAPAGTSIPVDGVVVGGVANIDRSALTGEPSPCEVGPGDLVYCGSHVVGGELRIRAEKTGSDTVAAGLSRALLAASKQKPKIERDAERLSARSLAPFVSASALTAVAIGPLSGLAVLFNTPFNGIRLSMGIHGAAHLDLASRSGIMIKNVTALEEFTRVDTILFDKTGTLTEETPIITAIHVAGGWEEDQLLALAAAAEQRLTHPVARALLAESERRQLQLPPLDHRDFSVGLGVSATVGGSALHVGSPRFMKIVGCDDAPEPGLRTDRQAPAGRSLLYVGLDGHIIGIVELASKLRDDAVATLDHLRRSGIRHLRIVSGDTPAATRALARELGIDEFDAGILPDQKADVIARLQREGRRVCYVGDGVNDSLALSVADVSVSMAGAALVAQDAADVLLLDGHLAGLASLHDISSQLFRRSRAGLVSLYGGSVVSAVAASLSLVNLGGVIVIVGSLMAGTYAHALLPFRQRALRKRADQ